MRGDDGAVHGGRGGHGMVVMLCFGNILRGGRGGGGEGGVGRECGYAIHPAGGGVAGCRGPRARRERAGMNVSNVAPAPAPGAAWAAREPLLLACPRACAARPPRRLGSRSLCRERPGRPPGGA